MSSVRSQRVTSDVARSSGSSSAYRRTIEPSVALTVVWPVRAIP